MSKTLAEEINKLYTFYLSSQVTNEQINILLLIARKGNPHTFELKKYFNISKKEINQHCTFLLKRDVIRRRRNGKGPIVELTKRGESLIKKINALSKHKNIVEIITCPKCHRTRQKSTHHIFPKQYFENSSITIDLCQECHNELGKLVHDTPKMSEEEYIQITLKFMRDKKEKKSKFKKSRVHCRTRPSRSKLKTTAIQLRQ